MTCRVLLIASTPSPDSVVAAAARLCYSDVSAADLLVDGSSGKNEKLLEHLWKSGHFSPFEHASFTFAIDGLSRVASHQLVRHRIASFSQQSQRYVSMDSPDVIMPLSIAGNPVFAGKFFALADQQRLTVNGGTYPERGRPVHPASRMVHTACYDHECP